MVFEILFSRFLDFRGGGGVDGGVDYYGYEPGRVVYRGYEPPPKKSRIFFFTKNQNFINLR